jgi:hypothetical protein
MRTGLEGLFALAWAALAYAAVRAYAGPASEARARVVGAVAGVLVAGLLLLHYRAAPVAAALAAIAGNSVPATPHDVRCRPALLRATAAGRGALDSVRNDDVADSTIAEGATVRRGDVLEVRGWAADGGALEPVDAACVTIDGHIVAQRARYGLPRPDVASAMGGAALGSSGYADQFAARDLAPGAHTLTVLGLRRGAVERIDGSRRFVVVPDR